MPDILLILVFYRRGWLGAGGGRAKGGLVSGLGELAKRHMPGSNPNDNPVLHAVIAIAAIRRGITSLSPFAPPPHGRDGGGLYKNRAGREGKAAAGTRLSRS